MTHVEEPLSASSEPKEPLKRKVPEWALKAFKEFLDHQKYSDRILHLSESGLRLATGMPNIVTAIAHAEGISNAAEAPNKAEFDKNFAEARAFSEIV